MSTGPGSTRFWLAAASRSLPSTSAGWISNSPRPAPSARESSTSATAWSASRLVRRALGGTGLVVTGIDVGDHYDLQPHRPGNPVKELGRRHEPLGTAAPGPSTCVVGVP